MKKFIFLLLLIRFFYAIEGFIDERRLLDSVSDAREYHELALNISEGKGYVRDGKFEIKRPPFFPLFLSFFYLFKKTPLISFFINIFLSIFILFFAFKKLKGKDFNLFSLFFIFSPNLNLHSLFPTADFIFGFFLFFLYIFLKEEKIPYAIFILSLICYIKPVSLLLPPFIFLYFIFNKKIRKAFYLLFIPYLFSLIWVFVIYKHTGYPGFSTIIPLNFYAYYLPFAKALRERVPFSVAREKMSEELLSNLPDKYTDSEFYRSMIYISFKELKHSFFYFLPSHLFFSLNTLISPVSFKPLVFYTTCKEIKTPLQQEIFRFFFSGKIKEGFKKFWEERVIPLNLKGFFILFFSIFFNTLLLILFLCKLKKNFKKSYLMLLILFPLVFSTGILGEARFRCMFEILMIYFVFSNS